MTKCVPGGKPYSEARTEFSAAKEFVRGSNVRRLDGDVKGNPFESTICASSRESGRVSARPPESSELDGLTIT